jgi:hypothetical protein
MLFLVGFIQISLVLIKIHPNQNVYFNSLIGGLSGAKEKNIPSWGNSFGNAYYQAILWLNKNAEKDARLALVQGTGLNIPRFLLRDDIGYSNQTWSAINRQGEYLLELTHQSPVRAYPYAWDYIEKTLNPVYEVKVDGVAIAKLWKNDLKNTKKEFQKPEKSIISELTSNLQEKTLLITLPEITIITRAAIKYQTSNCLKPKGSVSISTDGITYTNQPETYPDEFVTEVNLQPNTIYYYFPLNKAKFIKFTDNSKNSCIFNSPNVEIKGL